MSKRNKSIFKPDFQMSKKSLSEMCKKGIGHSKLENALKNYKKEKKS